MNINKYVSAVVAGLALTFAANAEILLWTVNMDSDYSTLSWDHATIFSTEGATTQGGTALYSLWGDSSAAQAVPQNIFDSYNVGAYISNPDDYTTKSFYIELYDSSNNHVGGSSSVVAWNDLQDFVKANFSVATPSGAGYGFTAVPEPTSGLMLLMGMAMLGLRRRKVA